MVRRSEMSDPEDCNATQIVAPSAPAASFDSNALPAGYRMNEYVIDFALAHGGFGIVYLARDEQLLRHGPIKEVMPSAVASRRNGFSVVVNSERHRATFKP